MHEGHRERMYFKLSDVSTLLDHELLEMALYTFIPRVNTNPTAHKLLDKFGTLSGVFSATVAQLASVDGVGMRTAQSIRCLGECMKRISNECVNIAVLRNFSDFKNFVIARMRGKVSEILEFYCLDKKGKVVSIRTYSNDNQNMVELGTEEIACIFATEKPFGLLVAHNHVSGDCLPSERDNRFTMQTQLLCSINNVNFYDHCIYASDTDIYSYRNTGELDDIKENFTFNKVITDRLISLSEKK